MSKYAILKVQGWWNDLPRKGQIRWAKRSWRLDRMRADRSKWVDGNPPYRCKPYTKDSRGVARSNRWQDYINCRGRYA